LNISNALLVLSQIPIERAQKGKAAKLPDIWSIVAFCLLPTAIAMLLVFAIQTVFCFIGNAIAVFLSTINVSVVVAIAATVAILFFLVTLVESGRRLFQSYWDSLGID
jgi:membrane-associated HD superfamily phosphohydrolase